VLPANLLNSFSSPNAALVRTAQRVGSCAFHGWRLWSYKVLGINRQSGLEPEKFPRFSAVSLIAKVTRKRKAERGLRDVRQKE